MQPFATRKKVVSNNNHDAFSALKGENLALMQSIQLHRSLPSLLPPSCRFLHALMFSDYSSASSELPPQCPGRLIPLMKNRGTHCSACFTPGSLQALSSQAQAGVPQEHGQDVYPHLGAEKDSLAPWGRCSCERCAQCPWRRDSCRRSRTRPRAKGDLSVCRVQELHGHWWIQQSTWDEEWTAEVSCCFGTSHVCPLQDPHITPPLLTTPWMWYNYLDVIPSKSRGRWFVKPITHSANLGLSTAL